MWNKNSMYFFSFFVNVVHVPCRTKIAFLLFFWSRLGMWNKNSVFFSSSFSFFVKIVHVEQK